MTTQRTLARRAFAGDGRECSPFVGQVMPDQEEEGDLRGDGQDTDEGGVAKEPPEAFCGGDRAKLIAKA